MKKETWHRPAAILIFAAVYFLSGRFGLSLAFFNANATAVWPPAGLSLAALLLLGRGLWPGVFIGAFLVNLATAGSPATSLGIAVGNTLEAAVGAYWVERFAGGRRAFDRPADIFKFVIFAALFSTALSATVGVTTLALGGFARGEEYRLVWLTWWLGDMVSDLIVAPLILLWAEKPLKELRWRPLVEFVFILLLVFLVGQIVFGGWFPYPVKNYPLEYLTVPLLLWAALRLGRRGAVTTAFLMSGIAAHGTLRGYGPFSTGDPNESLLLLQAFMGTMTVMALSLAAVISQQKRTSEALARSEDRFSKAFRAGPDPLVISRQSDGKIIEVNDSWERLFEYRREEVIGKTSVSLALHGHRENREKLVEILERQGFVRRQPLDVYRRSGEMRKIEVSIEKIVVDGEPCMLTIIRDVTEQRRAEEALRESEDRLRLAVEATGLGTWDFNPATGAVKWSAQCKEIHGLPPEAEVSYPLFLERIHPEDRERVDETVQRMLDPAAGGKYYVEYRSVPLQDGASHWIGARGRAFFDEAGRAVRFIGTALDITDRKRREEALKRKTAEAEEASRIKTQLISNVSHELRTPLNAILGYTHLLLDEVYGKIDPAQRSALDGVERNGRELLSLINQILDFSKLESGKALPNLEGVEIDSLVQDVAESLRPLATQKSLSIRLDLPRSLPPIESDPRKVRQILSNLLSNAIKFTEKGEVRISVRDLPGRGGIETIVEDTGIGIPPEELPRIFEAFHQADATATREFGGTGLGLAIVKELIGILKGKVDVTSELGKGSRFTLFLPYRFHR